MLNELIEKARSIQLYNPLTSDDEDQCGARLTCPTADSRLLLSFYEKVLETKKEVRILILTLEPESAPDGDCSTLD
jgi:hypothetical protein